MPHDGTQENCVGPNERLTIEKSFPADYRWVRRAIHEVEDELVTVGVGAEDIGSISIILAEALNNVVEHAYEEDATKSVSFTIRKRDPSLIFEIRDTGHPMPKGRAPIGNHPMSEFNQHDAMPEGGYGWYLIRELVRDLVYDRQDGENMLLFRYRLDQTA